MGWEATLVGDRAFTAFGIGSPRLGLLCDIVETGGGLLLKNSVSPPDRHPKLPWSDLRSVEVMDASRATVTRMAALGVVGLGARKTETVLTLDSAKYGLLTFRLHYVPLTEASIVVDGWRERMPKARATTVPPEPTALRQAKGAEGDVKSRLALLDKLLADGVISPVEHTEQRDRILGEL